MQLYPFIFNLNGMGQNYLWGGQKLKSLLPDWPANDPLAEIWAVCDRPEDKQVSVIANGPLADTSLRELMLNHQAELLGKAKPVNGKFPILIKLLDAKQRLSIQVHPPAAVANQLGGEPKTEAWLTLDGTSPDASIIAGLKSRASQEQLQSAIATNTLESLVHTIPVNAGDCMFVPAGRLHAINAGCLILEIQENSNTTYRIYDWERVDPITHQTRPLQLEQAMQSIDLNDVGPALATPTPTANPNCHELINSPQFSLERWAVSGTNTHHPDDSFELITCLDGTLQIESDKTQLSLATLETSLIPAAVHTYEIKGTGSYSRIFIPSTV